MPTAVGTTGTVHRTSRKHNRSKRASPGRLRFEPLEPGCETTGAGAVLIVETNTFSPDSHAGSSDEQCRCPPWNSRIYRRSSAVGLTVPAVISEFAAIVDVGVIAPVTT